MSKTTKCLTERIRLCVEQCQARTTSIWK